MNLILFDRAEIEQPLSRSDPRAAHVLNVLRRTVGGTFDAGLVNGAVGKATITEIRDDILVLAFAWGPTPPPLPPISVVVGLPRPQTARDLLRDGTSLGVTDLHFVRTEKGDPSYAQSTLWSSGEWRRLLLAGAAQAFDPRIPIITHDQSLLAALATLPTGSTRIALDNYESAVSLGRCQILAETPLVLAVGAERGWSGPERAELGAHGFRLAHLGPRILRTETAVVAALAIIRAKLGLM